MYSYLLDKEKLKCCYQCGKCSSGCDINRLDGSFQPHRLLHLIGMGATDKVLKIDSLWKCTTCFTCSERCPQGVKITEILWLTRAFAFKSGCIPELAVIQRDTLLKSGRLMPVDNKKREKAGLPAITEESDVAAQIFKIAEEKEQIL